MPHNDVSHIRSAMPCPRLLITAALVLSVYLDVAGARAAVTADGSTSSGTVPKITIGRKFRLQRSLPGWSVLIPGKPGNFWIGCAQGNRIVACRYDGTAWSEAETVVSSSSAFQMIHTVNGAWDTRGNPVLVWVVDDIKESELATASWTGREWSKPTVLDRLSRPIASIDCLSDAQGRIHVVYTRPLEPPEVYANLGEASHKPEKCYHVWYDGQKWSSPAPAASPGRYSVEKVHLGLGTNGRVSLSQIRVNFALFEPPGRFITYQTWNGKTWSDTRLATPKDRWAESGAAAMDASGVLHGWALMDRRAETHDYNATKDITELRYYRVGKLGSFHVEKGQTCQIINDYRGRIIRVTWPDDRSSHIQLWTGDTWTEPVVVPTHGRMKLGPDHRLYLASDDSGSGDVWEMLEE
jgi:hypothetical protein